MRNKFLTTITVAVCLAAGAVQPLRAQEPGRFPRPAPAPRSGARFALAPDPAQQPPGGQHPLQSLEDLRSELLSLADSVQQFAALAPAELFDADSLQQARVQIQQMPAESLNTLRKVIDPAKLHDRLLRARAAVGQYSKSISGTKMIAGSMPSFSPGFPDANGFCTSANGTDVHRIPTAVVLAADVIFFVADTVRELAQDACKQDVVVVALGEGGGGNTSLVCTIVDTVWVIAKAVDEGIHFCDDDLTGAVVDANFARLNHIHDDLSAVQTGVNTVSTQVSNVGTQVSNVDTHLSTVDTHITALIAGLSSQIVTLQASVDLANQRLLKTVAGELQIMKLELTPDGSRILVPSILTCTGSNCPNVLALCPGGVCAWNNVGPLP